MTIVSKRTGLLSAPNVNSTGNNQPWKKACCGIQTRIHPQVPGLFFRVGYCQFCYTWCTKWSGTFRYACPTLAADHKPWWHCRWFVVLVSTRLYSTWNCQACLMQNTKNLCIKKQRMRIQFYRQRLHNILRNVSISKDMYLKILKTFAKVN